MLAGLVKGFDMSAEIAKALLAIPTTEAAAPMAFAYFGISVLMVCCPMCCRRLARKIRINPLMKLKYQELVIMD